MRSKRCAVQNQGITLNALRKSPINWFIQSICLICISCVFSMLDATRSPWDLISSKARLKSEVLVPVAIFSIVHFAFPFALAFLSFQA